MNYWRRLRDFVVRDDNTTLTRSQSGNDEEDNEEENSAMLPSGREASSSSPLSPVSRGSSRYSSSGRGGGRRRKSRRNAKDSIASRTHLNSAAIESSEEESSTARLSRRSSVLVDLFALFRRSSSIGHASRHTAQRFRENDDLDESDEEDGGYQEMSKEKLLEAIRQKKEIIEKVRLQAWNMRRKRRTLKVAQRHLQRQKAQVSKVHLYKVEFQRRAKAVFRWMGNASKYLIPWESKIKRIESHFGSVVSSYFIFLRWVLSVNITMSIILLLFVVIPELTKSSRFYTNKPNFAIPGFQWLADMQADAERFNRTRYIKLMPEKVREHADELNTVLDFGGYLQYSYLFYGYYSSETFFGTFIQYNVPIAYFCVNLFILTFCLFIILKKMTSNTRRSKLSGGKQEQYVFTWKVITGWDYNIGNSETSSSLFKANVIKLREATADYNKKIKQKWTWMIFVMRLLVNTVIISMFALSVYAIYQVAQITEKDTFLKQNAVSITVVVTTILFPPIFELILRLERYRPRTALRTHLFRVLFFYLINYFTLIYSLFKMLNNLETEMRLNEISNQLFQQQTDSFHIVHNPYSYNQSYYEVVPSRSSRHLYARGSSSVINETLETMATVAATALSAPPTTTVYYTSTRQPTTTVEPMRLWTTVFPNYGPFGVGVYNPKAIVVSGGKRVAQRVHNTVYESRAIGPIAGWSPASAQATQGPVTLNYTSSPRNYYQMYRASNYDDLCWETLIGQEITKIVTTDLVLTIVAILVIDFLRDIWIRYCGSWWCWDIEGMFPEYAEFKVAENVLHLVNNQGMIWLGTILVPMLPMLNNINLIILMYIRAWACMTCNVPARQIFRASRSSNFYYWILLLMLCMSTLPVGFVIASKKPSKNCGPFGGQERFYSVISEVLHNNLNKNIVDVIQYIMSPGIVIPVLLLMLLIIYFLVLLVSGLKAANTDLSKQLTHERTEEKKKIFELAGGGRKRTSQFTFHRPSNFNVRADSSSPTSRRGSPRSRSTRDFSDSPPRRRGTGSNSNRGNGSRGGASGPDCGDGDGFGQSLSSCHDGNDGDNSSRGSPIGKTIREEGYCKRGVGIRRTVTERSAGALSVGDTFFQAYPHHSKSEDQLHSPSKSPISQTRFPAFLPSLQSVNEDDDEETQNEEGRRRSSGGTNAKESISQLNSNERKADDKSADESQQHPCQSAVPSAGDVPPSSSSRSSVSIDQTPVRLNWRQKMLVWIGLADPQKLELKERLKRQIARNNVDTGQKDMDAADVVEDEVDIEQGVASQECQERRPLKSSLRKKKAQNEQNKSGEKETQQLLPLMVVESGSSEGSAVSQRRSPRRNMSRAENREADGLATDGASDSERQRQTLKPTPLLFEEAEYSLASDEASGKNNGESSGGADVDDNDNDNDNNDEVEAEEVEEIPVVDESDDTSSATAHASTTHTHGTSPPAMSIAKRKKRGGGFPLLQSRSASDRLKVKRIDSADEAISEASPVVGRRREDVFPASRADANCLSSAKRSPQGPPRHATAVVSTKLSPTSPTRRYEKRNSTRRHSPLKGARVNEPIQTSDDPICTPSAENSFCDQTLPASGASSSAASLILHRMRKLSDGELATDDIGDPLMSNSFRYAEDPLGYCNPYSSYAAAMCSPITLSDYRNEKSITESQHLPSPRQKQQQPTLEYPRALLPLHHSYHQALQHSQPEATLFPSYLMTQQQQYPLYGYYAPQQSQQQQQQQYEPPQQRFYAHSAPRDVYFTGAQCPTQPLDYDNHAMLPLQPLCVSSAMSHSGYTAPTQMYDVPPSYYPHNRASYTLPQQPPRRQQQQHESPISIRGRSREEGGSTSGRGTVPPDYLTESPSGSSPEFGLKPKYRIGKSPMTGHRSDQGGYSSDTSGIRRFEIRQKSAVGGGAPGIEGIDSSGGSSSPSSPAKQKATAASTYSQQTTV